MNPIYVNPNDLLKTHVEEYVPSTSRQFIGTATYKQPIFTGQTIQQMEIDPRVKFGLSLIKGPMISKAKFKVESESEEVRQLVIQMINEFWKNGAIQALKAVEWGHSGSEVLYKQDEKTGHITYCGLKDFQSSSVKIVTRNGKRCGLLIKDFMTMSMKTGKAVYLGGPKALHHVHNREIHPFYGRSRLYGAHIPWNEIWSQGGYRDIRRMWFYKNAFSGGILYHPDKMYRLPDGRTIHSQDLAQEMIEKMKTGAVWTLPNETDRNGKRSWELQEAKGNTIPAGLFDYGDSLRIEILEAMGIPYEVVESSGGEGFGSSSGREIPETAFYSTLQEELNWLIYDFVEQVARPIVQVNAALGFIQYDTFDVLSYPLMSKPEEVDFVDKDGDGIDDRKEKGKQFSPDETGGDSKGGGEALTNNMKEGDKESAAGKNQLAVAS